MVCNDGTISSTCTCEPEIISTIQGCMDISAKNYDQNANVSGDCLYQSVKENATNSQKNVDEDSNDNFMLGF